VFDARTVFEFSVDVPSLGQFPREHAPHSQFSANVQMRPVGRQRLGMARYKSRQRRGEPGSAATPNKCSTQAMGKKGLTRNSLYRVGVRVILGRDIY
jgi:hypothetical protein